MLQIEKKNNWDKEISRKIFKEISFLKKRWKLQSLFKPRVLSMNPYIPYILCFFIDKLFKNSLRVLFFNSQRFSFPFLSPLLQFLFLLFFLLQSFLLVFLVLSIHSQLPSIFLQLQAFQLHLNLFNQDLHLLQWDPVFWFSIFLRLHLEFLLFLFLVKTPSNASFLSQPVVSWEDLCHLILRPFHR